MSSAVNDLHAKYPITACTCLQLFSVDVAERQTISDFRVGEINIGTKTYIMLACNHIGRYNSNLVNIDHRNVCQFDTTGLSLFIDQIKKKQVFFIC